MTYDEIAARRLSPDDTERRDCLAIFLRIQETDDQGLMDDEMIAGFQRLLLVAGNDTTAATLSWVAERLVRHPEVLQRLEETLAAGDDTYLDAVITETLRLRPPSRSRCAPSIVMSYSTTCTYRGGRWCSCTSTAFTAGRPV